MRLFLALTIPDAAKTMLEKSQKYLRKELSVRDVRWTKMNTFHLTLEFLGEAPLQQVPVLISSIQHHVIHSPPPTCVLGTLHCFPNYFKPTVLVQNIIMDEVGARLKQGIHEELGLLQLTNDFKGWQPHVTLGRLKDAGQINGELFEAYKVEHLLWIAQSVDLFESKLSSEGAEHRLIQTFKFEA